MPNVKKVDWSKGRLIQKVATPWPPHLKTNDLIGYFFFRKNPLNVGGLVVSI